MTGVTTKRRRSQASLKANRAEAVPSPIAVTKVHLRKADVYTLAETFRSFFSGGLSGLNKRDQEFLKHCARVILAVLDSEGSPDLEVVDRSVSEIERIWQEWDEAIDRGEW